MIKFKDYENISIDDRQRLDDYVYSLYNIIPVIDDNDMTLFCNKIRHILEIISDEEIDNGEN